MAIRNIEVDVDIDLDDFSIDDLVEEISDRITIRFGKTTIIDKIEKESLLDLAAEINKKFTGSEETGKYRIPVESLNDEYKYELLLKAFGKYTLSELEQLIPV